MRNRAIFIFFVMFPVLLIAEYTGNNSTGFAAIVAGVTSGASVVLFPSPEHLQKMKDNSDKITDEDEDEDENERRK